MKLKTVKSVDPRDTSVIHYRLSPFYSYKVTLDDMAEDISHSSSVNKADVVAVLETLKHEFVSHVTKGGIVEFNGFGTYRLSISSIAKDSPDLISLSDIKKQKVLFRLSKELQSIIDRTKFEKIPYGETD